MRTPLRYLLLGLVLLCAGALLGLYPYRAALLPTADDLTQAKRALAPHLTLSTPAGAGPFPTVLAFHGCSGQTDSFVNDLQSWLLPAGYAIVFVDSYAARGVEDWQPVCAGKQLWGNERALDVYAALELTADMPQVDHQRLALMGFSHGGWTILDALAYGGQAGHGYPAPGLQALQQVKAAVTYYPYCGFPAHLRQGSEAPREVPLLMLLASQDSVTNHRQCLDSLDALGLSKIRLVQYQGADHVFDQPSGMHTYQPALANDAHRQTLSFLNESLGVHN